MKSEKTPTPPKHVNKGMDLETKKAWSAPKRRVISTNTTMSQPGEGQDGGGMLDQTSATS